MGPALHLFISRLITMHGNVNATSTLIFIAYTGESDPEHHGGKFTRHSSRCHLRRSRAARSPSRPHSRFRGRRPHIVVVRDDDPTTLLERIQSATAEEKRPRTKSIIAKSTRMRRQGMASRNGERQSGRMLERQRLPSHVVRRGPTAAKYVPSHGGKVLRVLRDGTGLRRVRCLRR